MSTAGKGGGAAVTRVCGVNELAHLKKFHLVHQFRLGGDYDLDNESSFEFGGHGGTTLESLEGKPLRTAYIAVGNPEYDAQDRITNAVIINSYYAGDSTWFHYFWHEGQPGVDLLTGGVPVVGPGRLIDTDRFYVVYLDAVGLWGASKPSDGLGMKFPRYTIFDCVQANYRLLKDELGISRVRLCTGVSMGAIQTYAWAAMHPGFIDAIMPIGGSTSTRKDAVLRWNFELMSAAMMSDPAWMNTDGDYYHLPKESHPNRGMKFGWSVLLHNGIDLDFRVNQGWEEVRKEVFSWDSTRDMGSLLQQKADDYDVNDLLIRNGSQDRFDIDDRLPGIALPALVLHVENDLWLRVSLAKRSAEAMPNARFAAFQTPMAHYGLFSAPNALKSEVQAFFRDIGMK